MIEDFLRTNFRRLLTKEKDLTLEDKIPSLEDLGGEFQDIDEFGLYLHIPFCEQICPYCPYNKEIYDPDVAKRYTNAVKREINLYSEVVGDRPVTSFYIGGGTPTTMLSSGIEESLEYIFKAFNMQCGIHMESHPNHLTLDNLNTITSMGVKHLSMGVEALQGRHLKILNRPYTIEEVKTAIRSYRRTVSQANGCVAFDNI